MKLLKELELQFDDPLWAYDPELALVDTILNLHPELYAIVSADILALGKNNEKGRQDGPATKNCRDNGFPMRRSCSRYLKIIPTLLSK